MIVQEENVRGYREMETVCRHAAKNRRPGRSGYSPRATVFGFDETRFASGLGHYLEKPDDAALSQVTDDSIMAKSTRIREAALKAIITLDHHDKWMEGCRYPSRTSTGPYFPGDQVFYWRKAKGPKNLKGRMARLYERWRGVGVIIGREWDTKNQTSA